MKRIVALLFSLFLFFPGLARATDFPGTGVFPLNIIPQISFTFSTSLLADATGEQIACIGQVYWPDGGTHSINTVSFRPGTVVSAGGSTIDLSLQDVSLAAGPPFRPDGTQDQVVSFNINTLTSNTWASKTLGSSRSVAHGAPMAVVWEYGAGGRQGSDSLIVSALTQLAIFNGRTGCVLNTGSWALQLAFPNVVFTATDATIGTFVGSTPASGAALNVYSSSSSPDELAMEFEYPFEYELTGVVWFGGLTTGGSSDAEIVLYNGTSAVETVTLDANAIGAAGGTRAWFIPFASGHTIPANSPRLISLKPTTTNNVSLATVDVATAAHLDFWMGQNSHYWDRVDAGSWSNETTTRVPMFFPIIRAVTVDGGGGGGKPVVIYP